MRRTPAGAARRVSTRGFSLIDVLVSLAVVALLMTILLPTLASMHETARRIACGSNVRQIGLGLAMYAGDYDDLLPPSIFVHPDRPQPGRMHMLRVRYDDRPPYARGDAGDTELPVGRDWDGLGWLIGYNYLIAPKLFYCPSHHGDHRFERYARSFGPVLPAGAESVVSNYHFRGLGPEGERRLSRIRPGAASLVADSFQSVEDLNHRDGTNLLRADLAVNWFADQEGELVDALRRIERGSSEFGDEPATDPWHIVDGGASGLGLGR